MNIYRKSIIFYSLRLSSENNELFNMCESLYFLFKIYTYINRYINGDNESVTICGLNIKQTFITNSIQEIFNVKESVNVIKII